MVFLGTHSVLYSNWFTNAGVMLVAGIGYFDLVAQGGAGVAELVER